MAFKFYISHSSRSKEVKPVVTLNRHYLSFNNLASKFIKDWEYLSMGYDKKTGQICVKKTVQHSGGAKVTTKRLRLFVGTRGFIKYFNLQSLIGTKYEVFLEADVLILTPEAAKGDVPRRRPGRPRKNPELAPKNVPKPNEVIPDLHENDNAPYMCRGCGYSNPTWGVTHPHVCPKCQTGCFEKISKPKLNINLNAGDKL